MCVVEGSMFVLISIYSSQDHERSSKWHTSIALSVETACMIYSRTHVTDSDLALEQLAFVAIEV